MTRKWMYLWQYPLVLVFFLGGCGSGPQVEEAADTFEKGTIHISCDESFKPVIDEQVKVYQAKFTGTRIIVHYKPEAECLRDFSVDSIRMVIATRGVTPQERQFMRDSLATDPEQRVIARDLITVILNPSSPNSFFTMQEIRDLLTGKSKEKLIPVFDGLRATSTVRFMLDSVLKGDSLSKNVQAAQNSLEVIDYVSKVPDAVGFVGFSWIGNRDDTAQLSYRKKIKIAYLESTDSVNKYVQPAQLFIYTASYPMVRDLVYIVKEKHQTGLAHAFARFLEGDRGQLIFRRSYLMPVVRPNYIRNAKLSQK